MYCWLLLILTWLVAKTENISDLKDAPRRSAGWAKQLLANQTIDKHLELELHPRTRALPAQSDSRECALTSPSLAPPRSLHRQTSPNLTPVVLRGSWLLPHLRALRMINGALLRRNSSSIYTRWTEDAVLRWQPMQRPKAFDSQDSAALGAGHPPLSQAGTQHPARCWRFTSARSCAPSDLSTLGGQPWPRTSAKRAPRRPVLNHSLGLCPLPQPQVPPTSVADAADLACHSCPGAAQSCALPPEVHAQGSPSKHRLQNLKPALINDRILSFGLCALSGLRPGTQCSSPSPVTIVSLQYQGLFTPQSIMLLRGSSLEGCKAHPVDACTPWAWSPKDQPLAIALHKRHPLPSLVLLHSGHGAIPAMGKRGWRPYRRRRPRDSTRESQRAPKRVRVRDAALVVSDSSSDAEDVVDLDSDTDVNEGPANEPSMGSRDTYATPRPLTVFSGPHAATGAGMATRTAADAPKRAATTDRATRRRLESDVQDEELFDQQVLRQELPPDEFMSIATLLNRPYTTQVSSDAPSEKQPSAAATTHGHTGRGDAGRRNWPAGARPPPSEESRMETQAVLRAPRAPLAKPRPKARPVAVDTGLQRAMEDADRPWLHCSITGNPIGPAAIRRDRLTGRLVVEWSEDQTIAYEGRAVLPQIGIKLFLGDLMSTNDSSDICRSAPETPPLARQETVSKVRAQEEAEHLTRGAVDPSRGAGTPPSAFEADEAVTRFMAKWLYMTAGLGDTFRVCASTPSGNYCVIPCNLPQLIDRRVPLRQAGTAPHTHTVDSIPCRPTCAAHHLKPIAPYPKGIPPTVGHSRLYWPLALPPISLPILRPIHTPLSEHGHPTPDARSPGSRAGLRLHRLGRLESQLCECNKTPYPSALSQCPCFFWECIGEPAYTPRDPDRHRKQWHIPLLLRNRAFQTHPWARRGSRRRRAQARLTGLARQSRGAPVRGTETAVIRSAAAYTTLDVLLATLISLQAIPLRTHAGALLRSIRPEPYSTLLPQVVFQTARCFCHSARTKQYAGQTSHLLTAVQSHTFSRVEDTTCHAAVTKDAHTQPPRSPTNICSKGPPGPKSGERSRAPATHHTWTYRAAAWLLQIQISAGTLDARVVTSAQGVTGAGINPSMKANRAPVKPSLGTQATQESHPRSSTRVHKRTYARALRRAQLKGGAWYRGTWIGPDPRLSPPHRDTHKHGRVGAPTRDNSRHYRAFSWNTGGLGGGTLR